MQIALLAGKIEDIFATVFRQNVLTRFEELAFAARKEKRLTPEALGSLWLGANSKYYGDAVDIPEGYRWGWSYIPHFIHSRFYRYSYVFGQLLVLAFYRMYKDEGKSFVPKYLALLESGGSDSPETIALTPTRLIPRSYERRRFSGGAGSIGTMSKILGKSKSSIHQRRIKRRLVSS